MAASLLDMLHPQVVLGVASRIRRGQGRMGRFFGFHYQDFNPAKNGGGLSGPNTTETPVRSGTFRLFDSTRSIANFRAPGTGPSWTSPNPVAEANYTCARVHEKIRLDYETLSALSPVTGPNSQVDPMGQDYIQRQLGHLAQRMNNAVEFMTAGLIRGKWYLKIDGENFTPYLTVPGSGAYLTVDHRVPSGNLSQLNMLGAGNIIDLTWANPAAKIISVHLPGIIDAGARLHGYPYTDVFVRPKVWGNVITNTEVIQTAGSAATPFETYKYETESGIDGKPLVEWYGVLRGFPMLRWHVITDVLVDQGGTDPSYASGTGTLTPTVPENSALFLPEVTKDWVDMVHYAEPICENPGMPAVKHPGLYMWKEFITQPSAVEMIALLNAVPRLIVPKIPVLGTVVF